MTGTGREKVFVPQIGKADRSVTIYALVDPSQNDPQGAIRYIGKSHKNPQRRLRQHVRAALRGSSYHCHRWIRTLLKRGLNPGLLILREVSAESASTAEREEIATWKARGARLTNLTEGGEGSLGYRASPEARAKLSKASMGNRNGLGNKSALGCRRSEEFRAKLKGNRNALGHRHSDEARLKISAAQTGNKKNLGHHASEETRIKMSAAMMGNKNPFKGRHHSEEAKLKISAAHKGEKNFLGHHHSDETRARMAERRRRYWQRKRTRANQSSNQLALRLL